MYADPAAMNMIRHRVTRITEWLPERLLKIFPTTGYARSAAQEKKNSKKRKETLLSVFPKPRED